MSCVNYRTFSYSNLRPGHILHGQARGASEDRRSYWTPRILRQWSSRIVRHGFGYDRCGDSDDLLENLVSKAPNHVLELHLMH